MADQPSSTTTRTIGRGRRPGSGSGSSPKSLPIHRFSYPQLLITPILLAVGFVTLVVVHSLHDVNPGLLYSQCHARSRVPWLSHMPVLGAPACYLVSFFHEALASTRSAAAMATVLSFVGGLLTVCTVEAARACNASAALIAHPTGPWLLLNLAGGELVWSLVMVPAFLRRAKGLLALQEEGGEARLAAHSRDLTLAAEAVAVPLAVAGGFVAPSLSMLATNHPVAILVWLFFPAYVGGLRRLVRWALVRAAPERAAPSLRLEHSRGALAGVYSLPVLCSVLAHFWTVWSLFRPDDRREMTLSTVKFIEIDAAFIGLTALYWLLVEGGWKSAAVMIVVSALLGPGAGACAAWLYRESAVDGASFVEADLTGRQGGDRVDEETPLLG